MVVVPATGAMQHATTLMDVGADVATTAPELPLKLIVAFPVGVVPPHVTEPAVGPPVAGTVDGVKLAVHPLGSPETLVEIGVASVTDGL